MSTPIPLPTTPAASPPRIWRRLFTYFTIMFPLHENIVSTGVFFFGFYLSTAVVRGERPIWDNRLCLGLVSVFLSLLMLRAFDELKDQDIEPTIYPNRPLVLGLVLYSDVRWLSLLSTLAVVALNLGQGMITDAFLVFFAVSLLTLEWWFFPPQIQKSFFLLLVTHSILVPLMFFYIYAWYLDVTAGTFRPLEAILLCCWYWVPVLVWEIGRKVRAPEQEDAYMTYSRRWGVKNATLVVIGLMLASWGYGSVMGLVFPFHVLFLCFHALLGLACLIVLIRFFQDPVAKKNKVKQVASLYVLFTFLAPIFNWAIQGF